MTAPARPDVLDFLARYATAGSEPERVGECFADTFLSMDPRTAGPVTREALVQALPARAGLFAAIGVDGLDLVDVAEHPLDDLHTIVAATWSARFSAEVRDPEPLVLPSHFLLRRHGDSWQIAAYLNATDLAAVFADRRAAAADA
jgi:hypothetical protein